MDERIEDSRQNANFIGGGYKSSIKGDRPQRPGKGINLGHKTEPKETDISLTLQAELARGVVNQTQTYVKESYTNCEFVRNESGAQSVLVERAVSDTPDSRGGWKDA